MEETRMEAGRTRHSSYAVLINETISCGARHPAGFKK